MEMEISIIRPQARVEECAQDKDIYRDRTIFTANTQKNAMDKDILYHFQTPGQCPRKFATAPFFYWKNII